MIMQQVHGCHHCEFTTYSLKQPVGVEFQQVVARAHMHAQVYATLVHQIQCQPQFRPSSRFALVILQEDVNAAAVARMVDMSLEEVADLLGGAASRGPGAEDSALLAKQVAQTLLELEAALMTSSGGKHAAKQSRVSGSQVDGQALEDMMEGLLHQASR